MESALSTTHLAHRVFQLVLVLLALTAEGCASRMSSSEIAANPELGAIRVAFSDVVVAAHNDPELPWYSGRFGNAIVNLRGHDHMGLCYHWQELIYQELLPTVEAIHWNATGIAINVEMPGEHHAVVIWDPAVASREDLIEHADTVPSYVLDAWRRGKPDVYRTAEWLRLSMWGPVPPELESLPYMNFAEPLPFARD